MKPLSACPKRWLIAAGKYCLAFILLCSLQTGFAQTPDASVVAASVSTAIADSTASFSTLKTTTGDDSIVTFEQLDMPIEMEMEFSRLDPKEMLLFRDEFQQMHNGVYGDAVRTIKVWFIDDHIVGYTLEKPFDAPGNKVLKQKINIPVTWTCTPKIEGHTVHTATTLVELKADETSNKCTGWHIKLPPPIEFHAPIKLEKVKKSKKKKDDVKEETFGHAKTAVDDKKLLKKKKGKKQGFDQNITVPASDSTYARPVKDSI